MERGLLTMSQIEIDRVAVMRQVTDKQLKQSKAATLLRVSTRQIRRMLKAYRKEGPQGLISKRRGRASNRRHADTVREQVKRLVQQQYRDFGPTLAAEKLHERHGIKVNKETLRQWLIEWDIWKPKQRKRVKVHQTRARRPCFGELIQLDGSHHDWFEGRSDKCCLLVLIDDATSRLVGLRFEDKETTDGYFHVVREYIEREGRPLAFYSDKFSVFRDNHHEPRKEEETQFKRAMGQLGIELICADSPQAKGRVERANGTLQNRLVKEMRLRGINTQEEGNAFLATFIEAYNRRFAVQPACEVNAHREGLPTGEELDLIFSHQHVRTLSKNLELSYKRSIYKIKVDGIGYGLRHAKVTVCEASSGEVTIVYKGRILPSQKHEKQTYAADVMTAKEMTVRLDKLAEQGKKYIPSAQHPWRRFVINPEKVQSARGTMGGSYPQGV